MLYNLFHMVLNIFHMINGIDYIYLCFHRIQYCIHSLFHHSLCWCHKFYITLLFCNSQSNIHIFNHSILSKLHMIYINYWSNILHCMYINILIYSGSKLNELDKLLHLSSSHNIFQSFHTHTHTHKYSQPHIN